MPGIPLAHSGYIWYESAGPSMSELCSKFQAPPPQFQRMNQQEKPGPAAWPGEGAGGVAGCADTQPKGKPMPMGGAKVVLL